MGEGSLEPFKQYLNTQEQFEIFNTEMKPSRLNNHLALKTVQELPFFRMPNANSRNLPLLQYPRAIKKQYLGDSRDAQETPSARTYPKRKDGLECL